MARRRVETTRLVPIHSVIVPRRRMRPLGDLDALVESISSIGLLQPIVISPDRTLIAGRHRLEACRRLGWRSIPATVLDLVGLDRELGEIDENLVRNDLTVLERGEHLAKRKEIYEARHPQTKQGGAPGKRGGGKKAKSEIVSSFAAATAARLRTSARTVQHEVQIANRLAADVKTILADTPIADSKRDLLRLARMPVERQRTLAGLIARGRAEDVGEAMRLDHFDRVNRQRRAIDRGAAKMPTGVFEVIVVDPPWQYGAEYNRDGNRASSPYPEMSLDEIAATRLPAAKDCVVWLWTTHRFLRHAFPILDRWGFRDVAIVTVRKHGRGMGLGRWLRSATEFCIMAVKGAPKVTLTKQTTLIDGFTRAHSEKPDGFYSMVESLCVGRKLDMFARRRRPGWESFGVELPPTSGSLVSKNVRAARRSRSRRGAHE